MQYTLAYSWTLLSTPVSLASYQILPRTPFHIITRALQGRKRGKKPHPTWEQASFQHQRCFSEPSVWEDRRRKASGFHSHLYTRREVTQKYEDSFLCSSISTLPPVPSTAAVQKYFRTILKFRWEPTNIFENTNTEGCSSPQVCYKMLLSLPATNRNILYKLPANRQKPYLSPQIRDSSYLV